MCVGVGTRGGGGQVGHKSGVAIPLLAQVFLSVAENGRAKND